VAQPITVAATSRADPLKFEQINPAARQKISKQATAVRTFRDERNRWESTAAAPKTVKPPKERGGTVTPPVERTETVKPPRERGDTVTPPVERTETVKPPKERGDTVTPPVERTETVKPPRERGDTVTPPAEPREPASVPPREARVRQPERVRIPAPPIVGNSDVPEISQKGPPARPDYEDKDKEGKEIRTDNRAADRDTRKDGKERRGD